jgi:phenylacetic acid degradation operon negative regulatory protein
MEAEQRVRPWSGGWILVHSSHLGRTNKTALRARVRAFRLNGFAELVAGLWCRPDNFREPASATRDRLLSLGLEDDAVVMEVRDLPGRSAKQLHELWPRKRLESGYREFTRLLQLSTARVRKMEQRDSARETFLVGEAVIRQINADPLLPDEMIDATARREMISAMVAYNELGSSAWSSFRRADPGCIDSDRA